MSLADVAGARLEYEWIRTGAARSPAIVLLHEGLGSISMWRDFPRRLADTTQREVLVYSRLGYGRSSPLVGSRAVSYMDYEALTVLPQLLDQLQVSKPILLGHSDGASIAMIHAGGSARLVAGLILLAPHVFVEDVSVRSIAAAKVAYENGDLRTRLARHHDDVDGVFRGWNDIWLNPEFREWNIEEFLPRIACPVLAVQGENDEYGTMEQIERIARAVPQAKVLKLADCRHSPHRDRAQAVLEAIVDFLRAVSPGP